MILTSSSYIGTGSAGHHIYTGGAPAFLVVKVATTNASHVQDAYAKTSTMAADAVKSLVTNSVGLETGIITSLDSTGFVLGAAVGCNKSGITYNWLSIQQESGDQEIEVGSYQGNGSDNRTIPLATMTGTPDMVIVMTEYTVGAFLRTNVHSGDSSGWFDNVATHTTNGIQAFSAGGFQVGTRDHVNRGTGTPWYHYVALRETSSKLTIVSHAGTGGDNVGITGAGFAPTFALVRSTTSNHQAVWRGPAHAGDLSSYTSQAVDAADLIQSMDSDGITVGTDARVNGAGATFAVSFLSAAAPVDPSPSGGLLLLGVG